MRQEIHLCKGKVWDNAYSSLKVMGKPFDFTLSCLISIPLFKIKKIVFCHSKYILEM